MRTVRTVANLRIGRSTTVFHVHLHVIRNFQTAYSSEISILKSYICWLFGAAFGIHAAFSKHIPMFEMWAFTRFIKEPMNQFMIKVSSERHWEKIFGLFHYTS